MNRNRWLGLLLALSVAFSTLVPFFAVYTTHAVNASVSLPSSVFGDTVLICTGDGFALVKRADLLAGKIPAKQHKSYACALCYIAANAIVKALLLAVIAIVLTRGRNAGQALFAFDCARLTSLATTTARPRAPPVSFC